MPARRSSGFPEDAWVVRLQKRPRTSQGLPALALAVGRASHLLCDVISRTLYPRFPPSHWPVSEIPLTKLPGHKALTPM
jgi:hypothetical protein